MRWTEIAAPVKPAPPPSGRRCPARRIGRLGRAPTIPGVATPARIDRERALSRAAQP